MARGRKPKPAEVHILEGTFRADRHDKEATIGGQPLTEVPTPPARLNAIGEMHWQQAAEILISMGILAESDLPILELYAITQQDIARCDDDIRERGRAQINTKTGMEYDRPVVKHRATALARLLALFAKLGFTPADRRNLPKPTQDESNSTTRARVRK
jgi:P27 family predicted phage terminase small subunit